MLCRNFNLIELLIVLTHCAVIINLRRQDIVCHTLNIVAPMRLARNLQHILQRVEHLNSSTQLRAERWVAITQPLISCPQARRVAYCRANNLFALMQILDKRLIASTKIAYSRSLETLRHIYRMKRVLTIEMVCTQTKNRSPINSLAINQIAQFEQKFFACNII